MGKQFDGNGQQNDAEEFLQHIDGSGAENAVNFFGNFEYDVNPKHIEQNGENDIDIRILGADGKQCGQTAGTGYQRKTTGIKVASLGESGEFLKISISRIISRAMTKMMSEPAMAKEEISTWNRFKKASPT